MYEPTASRSFLHGETVVIGGFEKMASLQSVSIWWGLEIFES